MCNIAAAHTLLHYRQSHLLRGALRQFLAEAIHRQPIAAACGIAGGFALLGNDPHAVICAASALSVHQSPQTARRTLSRLLLALRGVKEFEKCPTATRKPIVRLD